MAESRERVIEAAADLFLGGSFHKTGIAEICGAARVNKGTFYHFFPSKLDLLLEVIDRYAAAVASQFTRVAQSDAPPESKLKNVFSVPQSRNQTWKALYGVSSGCFVGNIILEMGATDPIVRERTAKAMADLTLTLHPVVAEYLAASQPADNRETLASEVPAAAEVLMTLIQGAQVQAKVLNDPGVFDRYAALAPAIISGARAGLAAA